MRKSELKKKFLSSLQTELLNYNFSLKLDEFIQKNADGWYKFHLIFLQRNSGLEIDLGMLIRINEVENIYHLGSYYEQKYQKNTPTIGITIEDYLNDGKEHRLYLNTISDVDRCLKIVVSLFHEVVMPFFEKFNSIEKLDKVVNVENGKSIFSGIKYGGSLGIILAKLTNNPKFNYFEQKYRKYYTESYMGFYLDEFENILKVITSKDFSSTNSQA